MYFSGDWDLYLYTGCCFKMIGDPTQAKRLVSLDFPFKANIHYICILICIYVYIYIYIYHALHICTYIYIYTYNIYIYIYYIYTHMHIYIYILYIYIFVHIFYITIYLYTHTHTFYMQGSCLDPTNVAPGGRSAGGSSFMRIRGAQRGVFFAGKNLALRAAESLVVRLAGVSTGSLNKNTHPIGVRISRIPHVPYALVGGLDWNWIGLVGTGLVGTGLVGTGLVGTGLVGTGLVGPGGKSGIPLVP